jgi:putative transposase
MKGQRFAVEQIIAILKQAELGMSVADIIRQVGISEQTYYRWKKQYGGMQSEQVKELRQLQDENARLKKLVAELSLDKAILQDVTAKKWGGCAETGSGAVHRRALPTQSDAGLQADQTTHAASNTTAP